jgi:tRNA pseudouridine32 synthase/23S rRNA pseudouridine746 synthase
MSLPSLLLIQQLKSIPKILRTKVLYSDDSIIIIRKPSLLRSVPGHIVKKNSAGNNKIDAECENEVKKRKLDDKAQEQNQNVRCEVGGTETSRKESHQLAWIDAIQLFHPNHDTNITALSTRIKQRLIHANDDGDDADETAIHVQQQANILLANLATKSTSTLSSIPRKIQPFKRYCQRNIMSLSPQLAEQSSSDKDENNINQKGQMRHNNTITNNAMDNISKIAHEMIRKKCEIILLTSTDYGSSNTNQSKDEDSAYGQLKLLMAMGGIRNDTQDEKEMYHDIINTYGSIRVLTKSSNVVDRTLYIVHRLDCETSGVMVFARNERAASKLSKAWRERNHVSKIYIAEVQRWDPLLKVGDEKEGIVNLPLGPISHESIKWQVVNNGKPSCTHWKVVKTNDKHENDSGDNSANNVFLELKPITGRTHQLRIHCATIGSGIINDSLYGDDPVAIDWGNLNEAAKRPLHLHAYKLSFPHPVTNENVEFSSNVDSWLPMGL